LPFFDVQQVAEMLLTFLAYQSHAPAELWSPGYSPEGGTRDAAAPLRSWSARQAARGVRSDAGSGIHGGVVVHNALFEFDTGVFMDDVHADVGRFEGVVLT
jgi:hypothetical protein